jgi:hypothetical protein
MADSKITALTALTAADPVNDMFPVVDVSDTSMAASGTTKRISANNILSSSPTASGALTVTGLVTAGSATITGALTSNGGFTTSGVGAYVAIQGSGNPATGSGIEMSGGATPFLLTYNRTGSAYLPFTIDGSSFVVKSAGDVKMTLASGNLSLANGNLVMSTSGKGIDFSAVTGGTGTATANVLNDYEEGTWVPTLTFATPGTLAVTYGVRTGNYTKVGNLATARFKIEINPAGFVKGTASGGLKVTGLPFTASGTGTQYVDLAASLTDQTSGSLAICYPNSTDILFEQTQVTGTRVIRSSAAIDASNFAATNTGYISLTVVLTYTV